MLLFMGSGKGVALFLSLGCLVSSWAGFFFSHGFSIPVFPSVYIGTFIDGASQ